MTTTPDYAGLIAAWEAAMDGVTPGPWRPSTFGFQIVSDFPEAAWQSVVELRTIACTAPHVENEMKSQETIARWLARCSPDNISALLSALRTLLERNKELERERGQLLDKLHCMCGSPIDHSAWEGHTPVSVYDYSLDQERSRAEAAEAERDRLAERVVELERERDEYRDMATRKSSEKALLIADFNDCNSERVRWKHQASVAEARVAELEAVLEPIRRHYEVNDLDERGEEDALEIPVYDLRAAVHALVKGR